ncbi:MAG: protein translocase subunit SecF [Bauldia sp.]|nr:protein translocase subunit SecF [Bauldia sp.]
MAILRVVPDHFNIRFMRARLIAFPLTVALSLASVLAFVFIGPNYGIDFRGGTSIELSRVDAEIGVGEIREIVGALDLGDVQVQEVSAPDGDMNFLLRIEQQEGDEASQQAAIDQIRTALGDRVAFERTESVGARVAGELASKAAIATLITILAVMIYVWFRFEWQFAVGAIIGTINDVLMTLGFFVVTGLEFNLASIAAILTIVGFSLNDKVVVYDRIREVLRKYKKLSISDVLDRGINETMSRTLITSLTTLLVLGALFFLGGEVIRSFVAAMLFGVVAAVYSSIYIGAPVLIYFNLRRDTSTEEAETPPTAPTAAVEG